MGSTADGAATAAEQHQHATDDQHDDADRPEHADLENKTEEQKNETEKNHASQIPLRVELQTFWPKRASVPARSATNVEGEHRFPNRTAAYVIGALGASEDAISLYEHRGWIKWLGPTSALTPNGIVRTADEDGWIYVLPSAEILDVTGELTCDWRDGDQWYPTNPT